MTLPPKAAGFGRSPVRAFARAPGSDPGRVPRSARLAGVTILHIAHRADWDAALRSGRYEISSRGATLAETGFIHASYPHQLAEVARRFYADDDAELCVLVLDEAAIRASGTRLLDEDGGNGERFPHLYGAIDPAWVVEVRPAAFDADATLRY